MKFKRRTVTLVFVVLFLLWNGVTYMFLTSKPAAKTYNRETLARIEQLELQLTEQVRERESLLKTLHDLQQGIQQQLQQEQLHHQEQLPAIPQQKEQVAQQPEEKNLPGAKNDVVPKSTPAQDIVGVDDQLLYLEREIKDQIQRHERLLGEIQEYKDKLSNSVKSDLNHHKQSEDEDVVIQNPVINKPSTDIDPENVVLPVLVIACNRPSIKTNLDELIRYRPSAERFPIIVSQDCGHAPTAAVIQTYGEMVTHIQHPDLADIPLPPKEKKFQGYYKIARHYKWALNQVFHRFNHSAAIIVEDDLNLSVDFFEYFAATFPILHADHSLWCVSAWNDNGKSDMISDEPELLYRTDFFPGLGWMMEKTTWLELEPKWPATFWDDWMRHPDQRKAYSCIRPEISRTNTFGKIGVSKGQFFEKHLKFIKLNDKFVPFTKMDLSYLVKEKYDEAFVHTVYNAPLFTIAQVLGNEKPEVTVVRVQYNDRNDFKTYAKKLGIMEDVKSGIPRAGYRGVVSFFRNGRRVFFAPSPDWKKYDPSWT